MQSLKIYYGIDLDLADRAMLLNIAPSECGFQMFIGAIAKECVNYFTVSLSNMLSTSNLLARLLFSVIVTGSAFLGRECFPWRMMENYSFNIA